MPKKKSLGQVSTNQILGKSYAPKPVASPDITSLCVVCHKPMPAARISALKTLNLAPSRWAHTACSNVTKVKGVYLGESGTSTLQLCDKLYNDSVRTVFRSADTVADDDDT